MVIIFKCYYYNTNICSKYFMNTQIKLYSQCFKYKENITYSYITLYAAENIIVESKCVKLIATGVYMEIPYGYEGELAGSVKFLNQQVFPLNFPGTIDSDYRGEIKVIMYNYNFDIVNIAYGDIVGYIKINKIDLSRQITGQSTIQSAGLDVKATNDYQLITDNTTIVNIELPSCAQGLYQLRARSGLAAKHQIIPSNFIVNNVHSVSSILMHNLSQVTYSIRVQDRVAQLVPLICESNNEIYSADSCILPPKSFVNIKIKHSSICDQGIISLSGHLLQNNIILVGCDLINNMIYCINNGGTIYKLDQEQIMGNIYYTQTNNIHIINKAQIDLSNSSRAQGGFGSTGK